MRIDSMSECPFEELRRRFRGQLPPEDKLCEFIESENEKFFNIPHTRSRNEIERILDIHRNVTGWVIPSERFLQVLLGGKTRK